MWYVFMFLDTCVLHNLNQFTPPSVNPNDAGAKNKCPNPESWPLFYQPPTILTFDTILNTVPFFTEELEESSLHVIQSHTERDYVNECTLADRQLCSTNTTGFGQHSRSSSCKFNILFNSVSSHSPSPSNPSRLIARANRSMSFVPDPTIHLRDNWMGGETERAAAGIIIERLYTHHLPILLAKVQVEHPLAVVCGTL